MHWHVMCSGDRPMMLVRSSCPDADKFLLLRLQGVDPHWEQLLRKSLGCLNLDEFKTSGFENVLKLIVGPVGWLVGMLKKGT